jgi:pyruvate formate lyase activating enzyme
MTITGNIFDIKRYAIHDGPGIRTTVFLKGCGLSCPWCHNPESQNRAPELLFWEERCIGCLACVDVCPEGAIKSAAGKVITDRDRCTACGACVPVCPSRAREIVGRTVTVTEVVDEIEKDVLFYDESGGGVTLSGGEPLVQPTFSCEILRACKAHDIHTALDTCGDAKESDLFEVAAFTDLFLYDLKLIDPERHRTYTGTSNERILRNLKRLDEQRKRIWIRVPLIPGINDAAEDIDRLGRFVSTLESAEAVYLLPYHRAGTQKRKRLGQAIRLDLDPLSLEAVEAIAEHLKMRYHLAVRIGG